MKTLHRISRNRAFTHVRILAAVLLVLTAAALVFLAVSPPAVAQPTAHRHPLTPKFSKAVAFDVSPALRSLPRGARARCRTHPTHTGNATGTARSEGPRPTRLAIKWRWSAPALQARSTDHPRSVAHFRRNVEPGQFQHLRFPGKPAGSERRSRPEPFCGDDQPRLRRV